MEVKPVDVEEMSVMGSDPYKELEMYLDKVNEEIGEVFDKWKIRDPISFVPKTNHKISNGCRIKYSSDSDIKLTNLHNRSNSSQNEWKISNGIIINNEFTTDNDKKHEDNLKKYKETIKNSVVKTVPLISKTKQECDDFSERFLTEFNEIVSKRLLDLSLDEPGEMPHFNFEVDESESDPDYDDVFNSDEEESNKIYTSNTDSRSKSLEDASLGSSTSVNGRANDGKSGNGMFNYKITPSKAILTNFLHKSKKNDSTLTNPPDDAILVRVISLPEKDLVDVNPQAVTLLGLRRSTAPELPKHKLVAYGEPLLVKRKILISKSLNNSPQLPPKNKNNDYLTWSKSSQLKVKEKVTQVQSKASSSYEIDKNKDKVVSLTNHIKYLPQFIPTQSESNLNYQNPYKTGKDLGKLVNVNINQIKAGLFNNLRKSYENGLSQTHNSSNKAVQSIIEDRVNNNSYEKSQDFNHVNKSVGTKSQQDKEHGGSPFWNKGSSTDTSPGPRQPKYVTEQSHVTGCCSAGGGGNSSAGGFIKDAETQTHGTPPLSRSSSCTWVSECSSSLFNTGSTNASVSDDEAAVDDDNRSSSSSGAGELGPGRVRRSPREQNDCDGEGQDRGMLSGVLMEDDIDRTGEESGIGTASPPPRGRKDQEKGQSGLNKCKRKETWERLRRRQSARHPQYFKASSGNDVWVRRENVTTQTVSPEDMEHLVSDHTCNSSNENLLMEDSYDTSMSENSLRRIMFSKKKYNEGNQSSSGIESSHNLAEETDDASVLDSSVTSIPSVYSPLKNARPVRPTCLKLNIPCSPLANTESPNSSGDCLDDSRSFKDFVGMLTNREQPSPSSASLKISISPMPGDLGNKCSSVPALLRRRVIDSGLLRREGTAVNNESLPHKQRAQSEKQLAVKYKVDPTIIMEPKVVVVESTLGVESMTSSSEMPKTPSPPHHTPTKMERRMSHFKEYKFFRSFSAKVENWPMRKAEQLWRRMRERKIAEIEAAEACKWLRAAGFPQYAQMYEDMQFPINVSGVQSDHPFLDPDSLQSLFRRLAALNRCADMKVEQHHAPKHTHEESDEENQCALSENWQYERKSRRWSRVVEITPQAQQRLQAIADRAIAEQNIRDRASGVATAENPPDLLTVPGQEMAALADGSDEQGSRFRRTGSERLRDGAKAFLRRVESIKSRRRKRQNREGVVISSPQVFDVLSMQQKMKDLNCIDISPTANIRFIDFPSPTAYPASPIRSHPPSPLSTMPPSPMTSTAPTFAGQLKLSPTPFGDDSSSYCSDGSQSSAHRSSSRPKVGGRAKKLLHRNIRQDDAGALSDSECQPSSWRQHYFKDANSNNTKVVLVEPPSPPDEREASNLPSPPASPPPRGRSRSPAKHAHRPAMRAGSLNLKDSYRYRDRSFKREKSASRSELSGSQESQQSHDEAEDKVKTEVTPKTKGNVQRWHSFQRSSSLGSRPTSNVTAPQPAPPQEGEELGVKPMAAMSCGQLQVLRKLALLKLTACMERYCPTHRTGWNWELPKFIRKIKAPDYKDKTVFGVPLLVSLQRTGHALPKPIQTALRFLRNNALDQVGIFRKAGVRSRTLRLRQLAESAGSTGVGSGSGSPPPPPATLAPYDEQQAHDVADMVKQYFRELPDALLTNKLSETFIAIFQHVPPPMREDAVICALLLLPEEHREALQVVLAFLQQVADHSATNQMTASNLAVCLAPTLLRLHHHQQGQGNSNKEGNSNRSASASPRRRRGGGAGVVGVATPDPRELNESRAAHDCLLLLIKRHRELFTVTADTLQRCTFNSFEESIPVTLEELGSELQQDWQGYQQASTQALLKEAREKSRGWVSVSTHEPHVELCYRKVGDGHPLRLWRVTTEVEAPPTEVLHRILRERHIWDDSLLKWRVVERLNGQAEVFQYLTASMAPLQAKDYCVLRSWQSDLPRGGCCVVETSVSHAGAPILLGGVRAVVLASRYLIEPAGKGRSRLMHLARVDTKGRTPEWYNKSYGHMCALYLARIRASFKHNTDGPESNV